MYTLCTVCCVPAPLSSSLSVCTYCIQMTSGILGAIIEWKRIILCELIALVTFNLTPAPRARTRSRNSAAKRQLSHTKSKSKGNKTEKNIVNFPYSFYLPPFLHPSLSFSLSLPLFYFSFCFYFVFGLGFQASEPTIERERERKIVDFLRPSLCALLLSLPTFRRSQPKPVPATDLGYGI